MKKYRLVVSYDGTHYGGWQTQPNATSIQALIEDALSTALRAPIAIVGSSRTDAGVHAKAQVAHFFSEPADLFRLVRSLNGLLPPAIRVIKIEEAPAEFHARYSALSKEYHYHLHTDPVMNPFKRLYCHHILFPIDLPLLKEACTTFVGTRDFSSFANDQDSGSAAANPVRTLTRLEAIPEDGGIRLEFEGDSFLYKMVRNITGTLLEVAKGKISSNFITQLFDAKDRKKTPAAAPAQGLFLIKVNYAEIGKN